MSKRIITFGFLAIVAAHSAGCAGVGKALLPELYMTPEEKAEQKEKRDALAERTVQDLTTPGEPHDEPRDASIAGQYHYDKRIPGHFSVPFKKTQKPGHHRIAAELTLFENGSFAHRVNADCYEGDGWSYGTLEPDDVRRGQWKTENGVILVRYYAFDGDYSSWQTMGNYEKKGRNLVVVNPAELEAATRRVPENDLEGAIAVIAEHTHAWSRK